MKPLCNYLLESMKMSFEDFQNYDIIEIKPDKEHDYQYMMLLPTRSPQWPWPEHHGGNNQPEFVAYNPDSPLWKEKSIWVGYQCEPAMRVDLEHMVFDNRDPKVEILKVWRSRNFNIKSHERKYGLQKMYTNDVLKDLTNSSKYELVWKK